MTGPMLLRIIDPPRTETHITTGLIVETSILILEKEDIETMVLTVDMGLEPPEHTTIHIPNQDITNSTKDLDIKA